MKSSPHSIIRPLVVALSLSIAIVQPAFAETDEAASLLPDEAMCPPIEESVSPDDRDAAVELNAICADDVEPEVLDVDDSPEVSAEPEEEEAELDADAGAHEDAEDESDDPEPEAPEEEAPVEEIPEPETPEDVVPTSDNPDAPDLSTEAMETAATANGWYRSKGSWFYKDPATGKNLSDGIYQVDGASYCFDAKGRRITGWVTDGGNVFYFNPETGAMVTNREELIRGLCAPILSADGVSFTDVSSRTPHAQDIDWLLDTGVSTGWVESDGTRTFRPLDSVKRADMAAFLYRLVGSPEFLPTEDDARFFLDVSPETPHAAEIWWLASAGISTGWEESNGARSFRPLDTIKRADMAAFLYRLAGSPSYTPTKTDRKSFSDVNTSTPHADEIWWLAREGISEGWEEPSGRRTFRPMSPIVRQDMAAFLHREVSSGAVTPDAEHTYRFDSAGRLVTGWSNDSFYDLATGARVDAGWVREGKVASYIDPRTGERVGSGMHEIAGWSYLFDAKGHVRHGWIKVSGEKRLFGATSGALLAGGPIYVDGSWYLFDDTGAMCYGWTKLNGATYYTDPKTGRLFTDGYYVIGKKPYYADVCGQTTRMYGGQALANATAAQNRIASYAWSEPTTPRGWCAMWVHNIFERYGWNDINGNACDLYYNYCTSSDLAKLQVGMIVAVSSHPGTPGGQIYGHIGIYVGDGVLLDSSGSVRSWYIQDWIDSYNGNVPAKWGWYGGRRLS